MANLQKYTRAAVGPMCRHYERYKDADGNYIRVGNQQIDPSRSHLNYNLAPPRGSQSRFIRERCSQVYCLNRADVNVLCDWVVTAPKDLDAAEYPFFFADAYTFLETRYGRENVASAYVHMDESGQPHMHFAFVPVYYDTSKQRYTVAAKKVIDRKELASFHPELEAYVSERLGHHVSIMTGELSNRPDLTLEQYKALKQTQKDLSQATERLTEAHRAETEAKASADMLNAVYEPQKAALDEMQARAVDIKPLKKRKHPLSGKVKSVELSAEQWDTVRAAYIDRHVTEAEARATKTAIDSFKASDSYQQTQKDIVALKQQIQRQKKNIKELGEENKQLRSELDYVGRVLDSDDTAKAAFEKAEKELEQVAHIGEYSI